jgi:hypothetical protein
MALFGITWTSLRLNEDTQRAVNHHGNVYKLDFSPPKSLLLLHIKIHFPTLQSIFTSNYLEYPTSGSAVLKMSSSTQTPLVGLHYPEPILGAEPDALDWKKLKAMKAEDKIAQIIKRANFFCYIHAPPGVGNRPLIEAKQQAMKDKAYSTYRSKRSKDDVVVPLE